MMRAYSLLVVLCLVFSAHGLFPKRLIQFNETSKQWLSEWDLEKLMFAPGMHHFMDVTDFDGQQLNPLGSDIPLPSAPSHQTYYRSADGFTSSHFVYSTFNQYAQRYPNSGITVQNVTGTGYSQVSVIATIPGTGPNKDSIVVIGGHLDSIGRTHTGRAPGADDDASGTSSVLEIFRVLISQGYKPDFTIQFMAYSGEEAGLLGSQAIANSYALAGKSVYAVLQLDMTGYDNGPIGIIDDFTSTDLNSFLEQLVTTYTTLKYTSSTCGYGCSDHASWTKAGYRASFPFEAAFGKHNPHIHTPNDLLEHLDQAKLVQYVNLGISFAVELDGLVQ